MTEILEAAYVVEVAVVLILLFAAALGGVILSIRDRIARKD